MAKNNYKQELKVDKHRVIQASIECPESKATLEALFPEVFEEQKIFSKIGVVLKRDKYPNQTYALIKCNGEVRLLNITCNFFWKDAIMKVSQLKDINRETITVGEFLRLVGGREDFKIINM